MSSPDFSFENAYGVEDYVCGIDEVGRGPLAGPVVAAAVVLPRSLPDCLVGVINDSKKISPQKRAVIYSDLYKYAHIGIGSASVEEIDEINILQATFKAMSRAFEVLSKTCSPKYALIDGNKSPDLPCHTKTIIKGDQHSLSIAAASIVAKHYRDELMSSYAVKYPHYGWERNAGYGTKAHIEALQIYGVTIHHRCSFSPVANQLLKEKSITN